MARAHRLAVELSDQTGRVPQFKQPDGGEGLAKHKGITARRCLKEVWSKTAT
jgi:hypothetical protein